MSLRMVALLALAVLACAGDAPAHVPANADVVGGRSIAPQRQQSAETIATRTRFFGAGNVDQATGAVRRDRIIMSWYGVTNFAVALRGHVVLFDAWVARGAHSGYIPTTPEELAKLEPEAIFIGHAHFDHGADAVPVARASGATLVGTKEHCDGFAAQGAQQGLPPRCVAAVPAFAAPGTTRSVDGVLPATIEVTAVKHLHSGAKGPRDDGTGYHVPILPVPNLSTIADNPPTPQDVAHLVDHADDAEGGSVLYRFRTAGFTLVWHDTSGPLLDDAPRTFEAFRKLGPVDVQVGAIQGFNQVTNGLRDPRLYVEAIRPRIFVPSHHDDWLAGITTKGDAYRGPWAQELQRTPSDIRPETRFIADPGDYLRPDALTFALALQAPRLTRMCVGNGRLRVALKGDLDDVTAVSYRVGRRTRRGPGAVTFTPAEVRRGSRLRATLTLSDGTTRVLARTLPCRTGGK